MQIFVCKQVLLLLPKSNEAAKPKPGLIVAPGDKKWLQKAVRIMKIAAILLLATCLQVTAAGHAQKISLSEKDAPIEKIFKKIERMTDYKFLYMSELLDKANKVTISVKDASVEQVLDLCLKEQLFDYEINETTIVIRPRLGVKNKVSPELTISELIDVSGKVTDNEGRPLIGANVKVRGTNIGVTTDNNGNFLLKNVSESAVLEISFVGHEMKTLTVRGVGFVSIALDQKLSLLDETVVIAYGTTTRRLNTGNVSTVKATDIEKQPVNNPLLALQGRVPGMEITQSTGLPGSGVKVQIRGQNSIQSGNDPLYIIDGVPYFSQNITTGLNGILGYSGTSAAGSPLSNINPADIESIDVLKDADATAIYGSRGANGVVLLTTKKGKVGKMKVDVNMQSGFGKVTRKLDVLNTRQYLDMRYEAYNNDSRIPSIATGYDLTVWDTTRNTDWQKELIGGTSQYNDLQANLSGGNVNIQYLVGGGYHKETTVFPGDMADKKGSILFNINCVSANQKFRLMLSGNYLADNNKLMAQDLTTLAITLPPDAPPLYKQDGSLNWAPNPSGFGTWQNPLTYLLLKFNNSTTNLISNAIISYKVFRGLEIKSNFGYTNTQSDQYNLFPSTYSDPAKRQSLGNSARSARFAYNTIRSWIIEPQANYSVPIGRGTLTALIGTTIQQSKSNGQNVNGYGYSNDLVLRDITSASSVAISSINSMYKYNALFGRINFNWKDKYLANLTARRDGTSRFGPANRFHNFKAIGIGWVFSKEEFIQRNLSFISFGKLRTSYGTTGNDQVGDYSFLDLYNPISGYTYQGVTGIMPVRLFTPDLAWEETRKLEAGIELGFLKEKVVLMASYYSNRSSNQLTSYTLPYVTGFASISKNLDALVQNTGWEFLLNTTNVTTKDFRWTSSINLTVNRNKLVSVAPGMSDNYKMLTGYPLGTNYHSNLLGVDPVTGLYQFGDGKGGATLRPDTLDYFLSARPHNTLPKFYGGFQNSIIYKGFQLDFLFQFVKQIGRNYLYAGIPGTLRNQPVTVLSRWQKPGDISSIQRFSHFNSTVSSSWNYALYSDQGYSDASFIRLKNLSLSWQLPDLWRDKIHFQNFRIFIQAQNLFVITNYQGIDPENQNASSLPPLRIITVGVQVTL